MSNPYLEFDRRIRSQHGVSRIAGADEAGRGAWAGPLFAAAVILPWPVPRVLLSLQDSKKLSPRRRERFCALLEEHALSWQVAQVSEKELDVLNVLRASLQAMRRAVEGLSPKTPPDLVLVDGPFPLPGLALPQRAVVDGDARSLSVAAASILAKVHRDRAMARLDSDFPGYGLSRHKGYGTFLHRECLKRLGPSPIHRKSFEPIRQMEPAFPSVL